MIVASNLIGSSILNVASLAGFIKLSSVISARNYCRFLVTA